MIMSVLKSSCPYRQLRAVLEKSPHPLCGLQLNVYHIRPGSMRTRIITGSEFLPPTLENVGAQMIVPNGKLEDIK